MAGPMWGGDMPVKKTFVLVEYEDNFGIEQKPLFDFPAALDFAYNEA